MMPAWPRPVVIHSVWIAAALNPGKGEVFFILPADHAGLGSGKDINSAGPKTTHKIPVHGVFVNVQTNLAQAGFAGCGKISSIAASSAAMSLSISSRLAW